MARLRRRRRPQLYRSGVEKALDIQALHSGDDTILFAACVNKAGRVVGGLRAKGPYQSADEAHALHEWSGQPGYDAVRKMITDRLPFGVVEMKTAWVTDDPDRSRQLTSAISRTPLHAMGLLDIQFIVATAASYVLKRWLSSGGILASRIPPTPIPMSATRRDWRGGTAERSPITLIPSNFRCTSPNSEE